MNRSKILWYVLAPDGKQILALLCWLLLKNAIQEHYCQGVNLVLVQCFLRSDEKLWNTTKCLEAFTNCFLSAQFSALKLAVGQVSAKTNLSFAAVEILKPYQILEWCHSNAVIACLPRDLLMAVEVLIHQGAQIIETIHLLYTLPFCLCCDFLQPCDICQWCHT